MEVMSSSILFSGDFFGNDTNHNDSANYTVDEVLSPSFQGNLLVVWVIGTSRRTLTPSDVYLFHMTIADGLMALTVPFSTVNLIHGWVFGDFMCKLVNLIFEMNFYTSILFLVFISFDRYLVIVRARETLNSRKRMCSRILCAAVWAFGSVLSLPALFNKVFKLEDSDLLICNETFTMGDPTLWRIAVRGVRHILGFFIPLVVMVTCYSITIARLLRTRGFQKHRAMRVITAVVIAFLLCWTPYHMTMIVETLLRAGAIPFNCAVRRGVTMASIVTTNLALLHSCINPVLYAFVGEKFRKNMMWCFQKQFRQERMSLPKFSRSTSQSSEGSGAVL
ncbi:hypothetical protein Q5P01_005686 [Channa striata]|uniref:G-protein coupled receptors family 1 profile domain-containing protein n=1 Tax=Channa striata TaxID=64152 RepID=A0AA88NJP9_CHASR|nr:hypothetical protein Q5P01_005686 [Channa striata]